MRRRVFADSKIILQHQCLTCGSGVGPAEVADFINGEVSGEWEVMCEGCLSKRYPTNFEIRMAEGRL